MQQNLEEQQEKLQQACRTLSSSIAYGSRDTCVCKKRTLPPLQTQTAPFLRLQSLYPRFSFMQLNRKTHFSVTKWVRVAPPPQQCTCTTLTSICFEAYHCKRRRFPIQGSDCRFPSSGAIKISLVCVAASLHEAAVIVPVFPRSCRSGNFRVAHWLSWAQAAFTSCMYVALTMT